MVWKDARAAEEPREDHIPAGGVRRARSEQIGRNDPELRAQLEDVPTFPAQNGDGGAFPGKGVAFAGDGFDECGFAAAVWAEDADVFACGDLHCYVVQRGAVAPHDRDMTHGEQGRQSGIHLRIDWYPTAALTKGDILNSR